MLTNEIVLGKANQYFYDSADRVTGLVSFAYIFNVPYYSVSYNSTNGLMAQVSNKNSGIKVEYGYDGMDRITNITYKTSTNSVIAGYGYWYNNADMITNQTVSGFRPQTNAFGYDDLDRLISETSTGYTNTYSYDLAGNRTNSVIDGVTNSYTLGIGNRLASFGADSENTLSYNQAGCVTYYILNGITNSLTWNSRYQLTEVTTNGVAAERNGFDALGRRVWNWDGVETNYFVYSGQQILADVDATGGIKRVYVWAPGIDNLLAMTSYTGGVTKTYYAIRDHLGSVHAMVDETGAIIEQYRMDAWGRTTVYNGSGATLAKSAIGNRYVWQGREISWVTGLYHFRARTWDPVSGRFLSNDPIGISGGLNMYILAGNCVTMWRDPFGLSARDVEVMRRIFKETVANMTAAGRRYPWSWWNNVGAGWFDRPYMLCYDQFATVTEAFKKYQDECGFDDKWTFEELNTDFLGWKYHWYGAAKSKNLSDPLVIYDPLHDNFKTISDLSGSWQNPMWGL
jgi:RHS repeat-associated protein